MINVAINFVVVVSRPKKESKYASADLEKTLSNSHYQSDLECLKIIQIHKQERIDQLKSFSSDMKMYFQNGIIQAANKHKQRCRDIQMKT